MNCEHTRPSICKQLFRCREEDEDGVLTHHEATVSFACCLDADNALASSSTSSNESCFTALIEYAQTPTANEPTMSPVNALRSRYGALARWSPGDRP